MNLGMEHFILHQVGLNVQIALRFVHHDRQPNIFLPGLTPLSINFIIWPFLVFICEEF